MEPEKKTHELTSCCSSTDTACTGNNLQTCFPVQQNAAENEACCGPPAGPASSPDERPGFELCHFVTSFVDSPAGRIPIVENTLNRMDRLGALKVRLGIGRNRYKVSPGLYGVGSPDAESPVLVAANYKLSFDVLRASLKGMNAWVLVLDTRGINVWCAAGKKTFSTEEVVRRVEQCALHRIVDHRKLILPQLSATGVSGRQVKKRCGFDAIWGPVHAADLKPFIENGLKADPSMRQVTFSLKERMVLIPVELTALQKYLLWILPVLFMLSGIGAHIFSFSQAWQRGLMVLAATAAGVLSGTVAVPLLLPWLPGSAFSVKGTVAGVVAGTAIAVIFRHSNGLLDAASLVLLTIAVSSFLAMNFTGATPFTCPSGVEKEMRAAIPIQVGAVFTSLALWIASPFL